MKIHTPFAAVERRVLWGVNENLETILEFSGWREINEPVVMRVITADKSRDAASGLSQTEINSPIDFDVEIRVADDELERRVVGAAREKFLGRRRSLRIRQIQRELPVFSEILKRTGSATDGPELLVLLSRRRERRQLGIT